jgi:hypothetical protein
MKLGKLLAAGKNLVSGRGAVAYRESKQAYLPKFSSPKNPFTTPAQAEPSKVPLENPVASMEKASTPAWAKTQQMQPISSSPKSLATWTTKLNPMTMLRGPQLEAKNYSRPAVQAELSLDSVKVVHNDLTDADVEIVPMKSRPARGMDVPDLQPAKKSWEILGERLLKVTAL